MTPARKLSRRQMLRSAMGLATAAMLPDVVAAPIRAMIGPLPTTIARPAMVWRQVDLKFYTFISPVFATREMIEDGAIDLEWVVSELSMRAMGRTKIDYQRGATARRSSDTASLISVNSSRHPA